MIFAFYIFVCAYCFINQVSTVSFGLNRIANYCAIIQCAILALAWPTVMLSWMVAEVPGLIDSYNFIQNKNISNEEQRLDAASILTDLYNDEGPTPELN